MMKTKITFVGLENVLGLVIRVRTDGEVEIDGSAVPIHYRGHIDNDPSKYEMGGSKDESR